VRTRDRIREPAVAGTFYPAHAGGLASAVERLLADAAAGPEPAAGPQPGPPPKAVIAPHAGYVYSGPVAASAFRAVAALGDRIERVVLVGPSHFVPLHGVATSGAAAFATPLGVIEVDREAERELLELPLARERPDAHQREHSLEVELPFLQRTLGRFRLVPLVVGAAATEDLGAALDRWWGGEETLVVVSSDLSHYHDYATARRVDAATARAIEELRWASIETEHACGAVAVRALLWVARRRGLAATRLDLRSSGDTAGPRDQVVGYGAWSFS
jgi:AmmeMemoRadiSam system protein B